MPQADTEGIFSSSPRQFVLFALFTAATGKLMNLYAGQDGVCQAGSLSGAMKDART